MRCTLCCVIYVLLWLGGMSLIDGFGMEVPPLTTTTWTSTTHNTQMDIYYYNIYY